MMGLPWDLSTITVAYSLDALERRGLKPPSELGAQWDWNTFVDYAKRLNPGDGSKYGVDLAPGIETGWYNWAVANGGKFFSDDYKTCLVNSPECVEAVEQYMSVANKHRAAPPRDWLADQTKSLPHAAIRLANGIVSMQTAGDWFFGWYDKTNGFRWDAVPMPYAPRTKKTGSIANLRGVVMSPTAQNRELAWAWMTYMLKREVQDRIPEMMGELPSRTDSIEQVYLNPAKSPSPKSRKLLKAAIDATQPLPGHPLLPWSGDGSVNGTANLNDVYDGKREAKVVLTEVADKLNALIKLR
jgi:ABC-type glycerol-3-phosphate transport system substrate-binding protein